MPPKKKLKSYVGFEEKEMYKKEIKHLKTVIEEKNYTIQAYEEKVTNLKRKLTIVEKLKDQIECPACMEIPRVGHLVCQECKRDTCPTCRVDMGTGKSFLAKTIIENIEHQCKFHDCEEYFPVDTIEKHIKVCQLRTVSCPHQSCNAEVALSKILDHLNKEDCCYDTAPVRIEKYPYVQTIQFTVDEDDDIWKLSTYFFEDVNICILIEKHAGLYYFCCLMFSSEDECAMYEIEMGVHEEGSTRTNSVGCHKFVGRPLSIDSDKEGFLHFGLLVSQSN